MERVDKGQSFCCRCDARNGQAEIDNDGNRHRICYAQSAIPIWSDNAQLCRACRDAFQDSCAETETVRIASSVHQWYCNGNA
jgi:hypothetical protein